MTCTEIAPGHWLCGSRSRQVLATEDAGVRWCFKCRKHLPHTDVLTGDVEPSYYDPNWSRRCSQCHQDNTYFPGCGPL